MKLVNLIIIGFGMVVVGCSTTIEKSVTVEASVEQGWRVLAEEYGDVAHWASSVSASKPVLNGPRIGDASVSGRICETSIGEVTETIVDCDRSQGQIAYTAHAEDMPFFVSGLKNRWTLIRQGKGKSEIKMNFEADLWPVFGLIMWPMMKGELDSLLDESLEELKVYLEQGKLHPREIEARRAAREIDH